MEHLILPTAEIINILRRRRKKKEETKQTLTTTTTQCFITEKHDNKCQKQKLLHAA
jgi:hypothetical protein